MNDPLKPAYMNLNRPGEWEERIAQAYKVLESCSLCPRCCGVNRLQGEPGFCRAGALPRVASYGPHFGEEPPLVGTFGSGTIFFAYCTMRCEFCQNLEISHLAYGKDVSCDELAAMMLDLQAKGCHNINFVTPTHYIPQILKATELAAGMGLHIPLVYNTGGYDRVESLRLLDGIFDIYMPDAKYGNDMIAAALSHAPGYVKAMKASISEMHRQVGDLVVTDGIARRGLIIRHLVLPEDLADSRPVLDFIANKISKESYINIMDQYRPMGNVPGDSKSELLGKLKRPITHPEYESVIRYAESLGLHRGFPYRGEH